VRNCPYCFAKEQMQDDSDDTLTWDNLLYIADLHEMSKTHHISLLGGEPTLHPYFTEFVAYLNDRNFHTTVFTSGVISKRILKTMKETLTAINTQKLNFVCNVNDPLESPEKELNRLHDFLTIFGKHTSLSFNIYKPDFDLSFTFDYIEKYNLKKYIRIGLTHPIVNENNLHLEKKDLHKMATNFMRFAPTLEKKEISAGFDCGMPLCLFSDEDLGKLFKINNGRIKFGCGPAIDIGTDMNVWACFPLGNVHKRSVFDFDSIQDIGRYYKEMHEKIRDKKGGIFKECIDCKYRKSNLCSGGCLSHIL